MQSVLLWNWPSGVAISRFSSHQTPDWITSSYSRHPKNCKTTTEAHNISPRRRDYPLWINSYSWPLLKLSHLFLSSLDIYKWRRFISHVFESIVHVSPYIFLHARDVTICFSHVHLLLVRVGGVGKVEMRSMQRCAEAMHCSTEVIFSFAVAPCAMCEYL